MQIEPRTAEHAIWNSLKFNIHCKRAIPIVEKLI